MPHQQMGMRGPMPLGSWGERGHFVGQGGMFALSPQLLFLALWSGRFLFATLR